jgi:hypothetical protein
MLTALSVACAMSVSSTLPPVRLNNQVPEGDQHRRPRYQAAQGQTAA